MVQHWKQHQNLENTSHHNGHFRAGTQGLLMYNLILAVTSSRIFHKGKKCSPKTNWFAQLFHRAMHFSPLELSEANAGYTGSIIFPIIKSFRVFLLYIVVD